MLSRRQLVMSGVLVSAARGEVAAAPAAPAAPAADDARADALLEEIRDLLQSRTAVPPEFTEIRDRLRAYFKANQKWPEYIDVGVRVWERIYDWQLELPRPFEISRSADGRVQMVVMFTAVVLRPEVVETFIGPPYDR